MYPPNYAPLPGIDDLPSLGYAAEFRSLLYTSADSANRYLAHVDELIGRSQPAPSTQPFDLVSAVFANQAGKHRLTSDHLAELIQERTALAQEHQKDLSSRLMRLSEALSIAEMIKLPDSARRMSNLERMALDLEKQERESQLQLWKDTLELRSALLEARSQYHATSRRMAFLAGGTYAAG